MNLRKKRIEIPSCPKLATPARSPAWVVGSIVGQRLLALDLFRGGTVALMILVNSPGSWEHGYAWLRHAEWHGLTPTDLVFPFFLFVMGTSLAYSLRRREQLTTKKLLLQISGRSITIFAIGLGLNTFPWVIQDWDMSHVRIMGVLQRIALCYLIAAPLCRWTTGRQRIGLSLAVLVSYWLLLGMFGDTDPYGLTGNAVRKLDLMLFDPQHLYQGKGIPFDPEGTLSTLPATITVVLGYEVGRRIQSGQHTWLWKTGLVVLITGAIWHLVFPINKQLWTSSYVLVTAGIAMLLLFCCLSWAERRPLRWLHNLFEPFGVNPLFLYVASILWIKILLKTRYQLTGHPVSGYVYLYETAFSPVFGRDLGSLVFALSHVFAFYLVGVYLHRKRIYIKI